MARILFVALCLIATACSGEVTSTFSPATVTETTSITATTSDDDPDLIETRAHDFAEAARSGSGAAMYPFLAPGVRVLCGDRLQAAEFEASEVEVETVEVTIDPYGLGPATASAAVALADGDDGEWTFDRIDGEWYPTWLDCDWVARVTGTEPEPSVAPDDEGRADDDDAQDDLWEASAIAYDDLGYGGSAFVEIKPEDFRGQAEYSVLENATAGVVGIAQFDGVLLFVTQSVSGRWYCTTTRPGGGGQYGRGESLADVATVELCEQGVDPLEAWNEGVYQFTELEIFNRVFGYRELDVVLLFEYTVNCGLDFEQTLELLPDQEITVFGIPIGSDCEVRQETPVGATPLSLDIQTFTATSRPYFTEFINQAGEPRRSALTIVLDAADEQDEEVLGILVSVGVSCENGLEEELVIPVGEFRTIEDLDEGESCLVRILDGNGTEPASGIMGQQITLIAPGYAVEFFMHR